MLQAIIQLEWWQAGRTFQSYLERLKPDLHVELHEHWSLVFGQFTSCHEEITQGNVSWEGHGGGEQRTACVLSPYCKEPELICIVLWGLSLFCHLVDCHQILSDMIHGRFMHHETDTAGVWCICVSFTVKQYTGGCHTNKVYNDWLVQPYRDLYFNRAEGLNKQEIYIWTDVCLAGQGHISASLDSEWILCFPLPTLHRVLGSLENL